ncbi:MAG TPA: hypothetical protein VFE47_19140 [Tepidisphaeraceae bacterium]|jgi:hypothetical protein|nr:hypothetical protein [Tepidisphaeraceae bacterium]
MLKVNAKTPRTPSSERREIIIEFLAAAPGVLGLLAFTGLLGVVLRRAVSIETAKAQRTQNGRKEKAEKTGTISPAKSGLCVLFEFFAPLRLNRVGL